MNAKRRVRREYDELFSSVEQGLRKLRSGHAEMDLRSKVRKLAAILISLRDLNYRVCTDQGYSETAATDRIRAYFQAHVGVTLDGIELEVVGSIDDYARRIRELRRERGFRIISGASPDEFSSPLKPDQYILLDHDPDEEAASRWQLANGIRKREDIGSRQRILAYLRANVGVVVTTDELAYVSNDKKEFGRRTRELRTQEGWPIATRFTGRPDLRSGEYVLQSEERIAEPHDRRIESAVQKSVYRRDSNQCQACGWTQDQWRRQDPRILELHHLEHHEHGGANEADNLVVLCSRCHDNVHAGRIAVDPATRKPI